MFRQGCARCAFAALRLLAFEARIGRWMWDGRERIDAAYMALAAGGLRGLLIASRTIPARAFEVSGDLLAWVNGLTFIGLVGLMDPPLPEAQEAIVQCKHAGIAVKMITGDHQSTGAAIANALGLEGQAISGGDLDRLDAEGLLR